ncbi:MAG: hypothetical protein IJS20_09855 [Bacteroidales bacterium]|nr:hypothetical protein [Bacteroidales bacterium]
MGHGCAFGFLLVIYTIVAGVLDIVFAAVAGLIVHLMKLRFKWLIVIGAALTPSLFLGSEFVLGMIASFYVSETKGVDWGFGDEWFAPLTQSYYLYAIDVPDKAYIGNSDESKPSLDKGIVRDLWVSEDSIIVACSAAETYSLVAFYPQEDRDEILLNQVDSLQFIDALEQRNLERNAAMGPNGYFNKKQAEAHREEEPIRHTISFLIPLGLWVLLIWYVRRHSKNSLNQNTEQKSN